MRRNKYLTSSVSNFTAPLILRHWSLCCPDGRVSPTGDITVARDGHWCTVPVCDGDTRVTWSVSWHPRHQTLVDTRWAPVHRVSHQHICTTTTITNSASPWSVLSVTFKWQKLTGKMEKLRKTKINFFKHYEKARMNSVWCWCWPCCLRTRYSVVCQPSWCAVVGCWCWLGGDRPRLSHLVTTRPGPGMDPSHNILLF